MRYGGSSNGGGGGGGGGGVGLTFESFSHHAAVMVLETMTRSPL